MKKIALTLVLSILISVTASATWFEQFEVAVGYPMGAVVSTDIKAYIDNHYIESVCFNDMTVIYADDLAYYGFDVDWFELPQTLTINRNPNKQPQSIYNENNAPTTSGIKVADFLNTAISVFYETRKIPCYSLNGKIAIFLNDLTLSGSITWEPTLRKVFFNSIGDGYNSQITDFMLTNYGVLGIPSPEQLLSVQGYLYFYDLKNDQILYEEFSTFFNKKSAFQEFSHIPKFDMDSKHLYLGPVVLTENPHFVEEKDLLLSTPNLRYQIDKMILSYTEYYNNLEKRLNVLVSDKRYRLAIEELDYFINHINGVWRLNFLKDRAINYKKIVQKKI